MAQQPKQTVEMRDFPGLMADMDERDLAAGGARAQTNLVSWPGRLEVRGGIRRLSFEDEGELTP